MCHEKSEGAFFTYINELFCDLMTKIVLRRFWFGMQKRYIKCYIFKNIKDNVIK